MPSKLDSVVALVTPAGGAESFPPLVDGEDGDGVRPPHASGTVVRTTARIRFPVTPRYYAPTAGAEWFAGTTSRPPPRRSCPRPCGRPGRTTIRASRGTGIAGRTPTTGRPRN